MPETRTLTDSSYKRLLIDLRKIIQEGKARAQKAAAQELIQTTWELGKRIAEEKNFLKDDFGRKYLKNIVHYLSLSFF